MSTTGSKRQLHAGVRRAVRMGDPARRASLTASGGDRLHAQGLPRRQPYHWTGNCLIHICTLKITRDMGNCISGPVRTWINSQVQYQMIRAQDLMSILRSFLINRHVGKASQMIGSRSAFQNEE